MNSIFAAHIKDDKTVQSVKNHLEGVAKLAKDFGESFNSGDYAYLCGLLHDIGKYSEDFQKRINGKTIRVDHSTAGTKTALNQYGAIGKLFAYCIAGHHAGLPNAGYESDVGDEGTLLARQKKKICDYTPYKNEVDLSSIFLPQYLCIEPNKNSPGFSMSFFIRMLYSCLVDADFIDTDTFMRDGVITRGEYADIESLCNLFNDKLKKFDGNTSERKDAICSFHG